MFVWLFHSASSLCIRTEFLFHFWRKNGERRSVWPRGDLLEGLPLLSGSLVEPPCAEDEEAFIPICAACLSYVNINDLPTADPQYQRRRWREQPIIEYHINWHAKRGGGEGAIVFNLCDSAEDDNSSSSPLLGSLSLGLLASNWIQWHVSVRQIH